MCVCVCVGGVSVSELHGCVSGAGLIYASILLLRDRKPGFSQPVWTKIKNAISMGIGPVSFRKRLLTIHLA